MFLVYIHKSPHTIEYIFRFIQDNSVLMGVITSVIVSSLWLRKFMKQKRAEAFFGFYAKLSLCLKALQTRMQDNGRLHIDDSGLGNIYSLIYTRDYVNTVCPRFQEIKAPELNAYKKAAEELKNLFLETENNVYPPGANRKRWYDSQHILFSFCEFIIDDECKYKTNLSTVEGSSETKHIEKCKLLIDAMNYIQEAIENAKY